MRSKESLRAEEKQYGPWLRATPDRVQKSQLVVASKYEDRKEYKENEGKEFTAAGQTINSGREVAAVVLQGAPGGDDVAKCRVEVATSEAIEGNGEIRIPCYPQIPRFEEQLKEIDAAISGEVLKMEASTQQVAGAKEALKRTSQLDVSNVNQNVEMKNGGGLILEPTGNTDLEGKFSNQKSQLHLKGESDWASVKSKEIFIMGSSTQKPKGDTKTRKSKFSAQKQNKLGHSSMDKENKMDVADNVIHGENTDMDIVMGVEDDEVGAKRRGRTSLKEIPDNERSGKKPKVEGEIRLFHMATSVSDHCMLVLKAYSDRRRKCRRPKLFRFESMWLRDDRCNEIVTSAWERGVLGGSKCPFSKCMEECRTSLVSWNKSTFGNVGRKISSLQKKLQCLEEKNASWAASDPLFNTISQCVSAQAKLQSNEVSKILVAKNSPSYTSVLQNYIRNARFNTTATPKPAIIVTPTAESHVSAAVVCAKKSGIQIRIRSGGHDYEGVSYVSDVAFIIIDMFNLRSIDIDLKTQTAWVQTGATLGELYYSISQKSNTLGFPAGICPTVGVGGHISGGGYGFLIRKFGLTTDNVVDAKIVDVQGRILDRKSMGEDLFWAIRGGGGASFGVILSFQLRLVKLPATISVFRLERYLEENATDVVVKYQQVAPTTDENLFMRMLVQPVDSKVKKGEKTVRITIIAEYQGDANTLVALLGKEFPELGLKKGDIAEMSWIQSVLWWNQIPNGTAPSVLLNRSENDADFVRRKSDYLKTPIPRAGLESIWTKIVAIGKPGLVFNPYGGKMNQIPPTATAFAHRAGFLFKIQHSTTWSEAGPEAEQLHTSEIRQLHDALTPYVSQNPRSAYLNYRDFDIGISKKGTYEEGKVYGEKYFNQNFDRLVQVKTRVDPENFFRNQQSIPTR
nr:berberine bridge enzyme-like 21 [Quercus suber]